MATPNKELMSKAERALSGRWGLAIGTFLVYMIFTGSSSSLTEYFPLAGLASVLLAGPLSLGAAIFSLQISRDEHPQFEQLFEGFRNFGNALGTYLLIVLFVLLWSLLLIIPGIIAGISYAMTFYIMADNPDISPMQAIDKSKQMMYGYKWKFFRLCLRFLGWAILCILTLGIGFFWYFPYVHVSIAQFYDDIKDSSTSNTF